MAGSAYACFVHYTILASQMLIDWDGKNKEFRAEISTSTF